MPAFRDLTGQVFTRFTALRYAGRDKNRIAMWLVECSCPARTRKVVLACNLISGKTQSCGCLQQANRFKHGHGSQAAGRSLTYRSWNSVVQRVTNPLHKHWKYYGGANPSIQMCGGLRKFAGFLSVLGERPEGRTLGRFSDVGNYSCGQCPQCKQHNWELNCAWQTWKEQLAEKKMKRALAFLAA
jgi:hypothetical protein